MHLKRKVRRYIGRKMYDYRYLPANLGNDLPEAASLCRLKRALAEESFVALVIEIFFFLFMFKRAHRVEESSEHGVDGQGGRTEAGVTEKLSETKKAGVLL